MLLEEGDGIWPFQSQCLFEELERFRWELLVDYLYLLGVLSLKSLEHVQEERVQEVNDFVIVLLDCHLEIEAGELGHVAMSKRVLSAEDCVGGQMVLRPLRTSLTRPNFVDSFEVSSNCHLFGKLGALC